MTVMKKTVEKIRKASENLLKKLSPRRIAVICCIAAALAAGGIWLYSSGGAASNGTEDGTGEENGEKESIEKKSEGEAAGEKSSDSSDASSNQEPAGEDTEEDDSSGGDIQETVQGISLPYSIGGSGLVIRSITSYDGTYIEDGSDSDISGVTVIILENTGDTEVEYASITVNREGTELQFEASALPAGGTVVVQEKNRVLFEGGNYTDCSADVAEIEEFDMSSDQIRVDETGDQTLTVTNLTDENIPAVRIFYKFYMEDEDTYVGGITYTAKITGLDANASVEITPSHYLKGSSRIMMIRTYDTAD